ncbi:NADPH-dependent FMN reductase [Streptomyces sp. NBS 14/10]|uniref:NADPH-dependent FMN reductase n=1 Tax=Streptomyces sp. NBS 14/10 TaxID=1945643 RepID=UPI000B7EA5B2|nr:NADPH-dependent FMN reductase [Streptomyces sp. NBS 14/10]KAK1185226.1 NADPH-dependent FMN reductase [Streptomyces sp. NBS 14/10]
MARPARVLTVCGSPSADSRTAAVLAVTARSLEEAGHETVALHLRDLPAAALLHADFQAPALRHAAELVEWADALIVGTPVYKAAYTGLLKAWLDLLPQRALAGKTVLPLATGGSPAHTLVLDYALRPVLVSMAASHIAQGCFLLDQAVTRGPAPTLEPEARTRLDRATAGLLDALPDPVVVSAA